MRQNVNLKPGFEAPPAGAAAVVPMRHDLPGCGYLESTSHPQPSGPLKPMTIVCSREESFNGWGGRGCRKFVPVLGGDGTKTAPPGDKFEQPSGKMR